MVQIAVVGDIHGAFTQLDVEYFNRSDDALILVVGDLERIGRSPLAPGARVATLLSQLTKPTLLIPGNHDVVRAPQLVAEALGLQRAAAVLGAGHSRRTDELGRRLLPVELCGYDAHHVPAGSSELGFDVVVCRPFSMGGAPLSFPSSIEHRYGIRSIDESARRLSQLVDSCRTGRLIFLAHNGPTGLGARRDDMWGRDFGRVEGDHGDRDLELAVAHARDSGRKVLAVLAGHMHLAVKGGGTRPWHVERDGTHYLNAARVPRIFTTDDGRTVHHHLRLTLHDEGVEVTEILVEAGASTPRRRS